MPPLSFSFVFLASNFYFKDILLFNNSSNFVKYILKLSKIKDFFIF